MLQEPRAPIPLTLFRVEIPWNPNDSEEGTYTSSFWASTHQDAIEKCADEMAQSNDADPDVDYAQYGGYADVMEIPDVLSGYGRELLAGPKRTLSPESEKDLAEFLRIVAKYAKPTAGN
ncbi:MAG: hypothetical protein O9327_02515 [Polaromonas sp.]|nr:hypothetical protein [Polaromonas sp.]